MLSGLRVLLAEDNPTNQLVATQMLESLEATVTVAGDGAEALERVHEAPFDVLLVDIEMPRMNGIELMRRLRAEDGPIAALPMIALTAYVMREHLAAIRECGADGVIAKPILSITQFGEDILACMEKRAALTGAPAPESATAPVGGGASAPAGSGAVDAATYEALADVIGTSAMPEFLGKVGADLRAAAERLEASAAGPDLESAREATHVLISVAGTIGAARAQHCAREINGAAHAGDVDAVRRDVPGLLAEVRRVVEFVESRRSGTPA